MRLLSETDRHPKMSKNGKVGVLTAILHLAPANISGYEVCPMRSAGCTAACLHYSGMQWGRKYNARMWRTRMFFEERDKFMLQLAKEIAALGRKADKLDLRCGVRLNGTSDIPWEAIRYPGTDLNLMEMFPEIAFYDYSKRWNRKNLPDNYKLIFSRSESNNDHCVEAIRNGMNVAVVFAGELPTEWTFRHSKENGIHTTLPVIDGDLHDFRYGEYEQYDHRVVIGLRAKGKLARSDMSGFVTRV